MANSIELSQPDSIGEAPDQFNINDRRYADSDFLRHQTTTLDEIDRGYLALTPDEMPSHTTVTTVELGREVFRPTHSPISTTVDNPRASLGGRVADIDISPSLSGNADEQNAIKTALVDEDFSQFGPYMKAAQAIAQSQGSSTRYAPLIGSRRDVYLVLQRSPKKERVDGKMGALVVRGIITPFAPDDIYCLNAKPTKGNELTDDTYQYSDRFVRETALSTGIISSRKIRSETDRALVDRLGIDKRLLDPRSKFSRNWIKAVAGVYLGEDIPTLKDDLEKVVQKTINTINSYSTTSHEPLRHILRAHLFNLEFDEKVATLRGNKKARGAIREIETDRQIMWEHMLISMTTYFGVLHEISKIDERNMYSVQPTGDQAGFTRPVLPSLRLQIFSVDDIDEAIVIRLKGASTRQKNQAKGEQINDKIEKVRQSLIGLLKADRDTRLKIRAVKGNGIQTLRTPAVEERTYASDLGAGMDIKKGMFFSAPAHYPEDIVMATIKPAKDEDTSNTGILSDGFDTAFDLITPEINQDPLFDKEELPRFVIISLKRTFGCLGKEITPALGFPEAMSAVLSREIQLDEVLANTGFIDRERRTPRARTQRYRIAAPSNTAHVMDFSPETLRNGTAYSIAHTNKSTYPDFGTIKGQDPSVIRRFNSTAKVKQSRISKPTYRNNATGNLQIGTSSDGKPIYRDNRLVEVLLANGRVHINDSSHEAVKVRVSPPFRKLLPQKRR